MASLSAAFPLLQTTQPLSPSSKLHAAAVCNTTSELAIAVDGEGISIHSIAPNRVKHGFSTGGNVKFLCAPLAVQNGAEEVNTWSVMSEKGEGNLLCWTQTGVKMSMHMIALGEPTTAIKSILQLDETGETVALNYNHTRLVCFSVHGKDKLWEWEAPKKSTCLQTFRARDCTLARVFNGFVLASILERVEFYEISPTSKVSSAILSIPLFDIPNPVFDHRTGLLFQLSLQELTVQSPDQSTHSCTIQLPAVFQAVYGLSPSHVLLLSHDSLVICDITYGTMQACLDISSTFMALIPTSNPLTFHAVVTCNDLTQLITITIPERATLFDAITHNQSIEESLSNDPTILIGPKLKVKSQEVEKAITQLLASIRSAMEANDATAVDVLFKAFRKTYSIHHQRFNDKTSILTSTLIKQLFSLFLTNDTQPPTFRVYPPKTIEYLLDCNSLSRDILPGGRKQLIPTALGNRTFLKKLLKTQPTPLTYQDYLHLLQHILDTPVGSRIVSLERIIDAFERDANTFFDKPAMRTVLSTTHLQQLLQTITQIPDNTISHPNTLNSTLDSIGLGPLLLSPSLSGTTLDALHTTLVSQTDAMKTCLETSSLISLVLHRQNDVPLSQMREREIFLGESRKRKAGQAGGWLDVVGQEGGMAKARRGWIRKPALPTRDTGMTHRFVATAKFQEAPSYSLDKMVI